MALSACDTTTGAVHLGRNKLRRTAWRGGCSPGALLGLYIGIAMSSIPGYDEFLRAAQGTNEILRVGVMPWEANSLMDQVFGGGDWLQPRLKQPRLSNYVPSSSSASDKPAAVQAELKEQLKKAVPRVRPLTTHLISNDPESGRQERYQ